MRYLLTLSVVLLIVLATTTTSTSAAETETQTQTETETHKATTTTTVTTTTTTTQQDTELDASKIGVPITIELTRLTSSRRPQLLQALKNRHASAKSKEQSKEQQSTSLLQVRDIPLEEEILSEKHLATYFGTISIDQSNFRVLFDTGSCEFWVPSSECDTVRCQKHNRFPAQSPRFREMLHRAGLPQLNIQYLSGKVQGTIIDEPVKLGDVNVKKQQVGLANVVDIELLDDVQWDGILGLAYPNPALSGQGVDPLFDTIIKEKALTNRKLSNQFAYYIDDSKGAVTFGGANCDLLGKGTDTSSCINRFQFVPVTEKTYWTVTLKDVKVQYPGKPQQGGFCPSGSCKAIVDTGTYLIYGPEEQVNSMLTGGDIHSCEDYKNMPTFTFEFYTGPTTSASLTVNPIDYILKFNVQSRDECVVGISPDKDTIWTFGQVFLRSFYTVFDRDQDRIGFARLPRTEFQALNSNSVASDSKKRRDKGQAMLEVQDEAQTHYSQVLDDF